ncbi:hypothetical protein DPMN_160618 [Dreissena polymorpha]|uniref:DUF3504 domain-containing protein n=1 Tax=Dreissena polymorpha TaxID=45954 RepID=A0A9D4ENH2_DREPO|nr:hypothetical protein DPMN_160618 [Dreissena polymorpha]
MRNPEAPFYVAVNPNWKPGTDINWYMNAKMGVNKLSKVAKVMAEKGNLQGQHTNSSGRKTMVTQQLKNKVAPIHVTQLSRHRNLISLNHTMSLEE